MANGKRNKMVAFVARVSKNKTHNDRDYFVFRITIPKKDAENLSLSDKDHLMIFAEKAKWYHMLDWDQSPETFEMLPPRIKEELKQLSFINSDFYDSVVERVPKPEKPVLLFPEVGKETFYLYNPADISNPWKISNRQLEQLQLPSPGNPSPA